MNNLKSQLKLNFLKGLKLQKQWNYLDQNSKLPKAHDVPEQRRKEKHVRSIYFWIPYKQAKLEGKIDTFSLP